MIMPTKPHGAAEQQDVANSTRLERPVVLLGYFGPMMLPSTCFAEPRTEQDGQGALMGFWMRRMSKVAGMAPMKAKRRITLVTPMMTETKRRTET